jgi:hypothetical protein
VATIVREVLNAVGMELPIFCGGASKVGFGLSGTWVGTVQFLGSFDGLNFVPLSVVPFASGAAVQSATATGNWEKAVADFVAMKVKVTALASGAVVATLASSIDSSYQDAFLVASSHFVEQDAAGGLTNVITVAAQVNRAWRCRKLSGGFSVAPAAAVKCTISDGASSIIWAEYLAATAGGWTLNLPPDPNVPGISGGGVVNTPGNSLVITLAAPGGSVGSSLSAEIIPA